MKIKNCSSCNSEYKPTSPTQKHCKDCKAEAKKLATKKWAKKNPDKIRETGYKWAQDNIDKRKGYNFRRSGYMFNGKEFTISDYTDFLTKQNNKCAGCKVDFDTIPNKDICVDHCHTSQEVRGILCRYCNLSLGNARDSEETLASLILYIRESNKKYS